jgi:hypothetical protein
LNICSGENDSDEILLNFGKNVTLKLDQKFICRIIIYEENNELDFENEFYSILLKIMVRSI